MKYPFIEKRWGSQNLSLPRPYVQVTAFILQLLLGITLIGPSNAVHASTSENGSPLFSALPVMPVSTISKPILGCTQGSIVENPQMATAQMAHVGKSPKTVPLDETSETIEKPPVLKNHIPENNAKADQTSSKIHAHDIQRWQTKKGGRVVFYPSKEVPMLIVQIAFAAGSAYDGNQFGLSALTSTLLNQGNGGLSDIKIAQKLADVGAQYDSRSGRDQIVLSLKTLSSPHELDAAIDTLSLIIGKPDFVGRAVQREKNQQLMSLIRMQEMPEELANVVLFQKLYGQHPYAHPILGTPESIKKMTAAQIRAFYKQHFVASNAVIVMVGDVSQAQAKLIAEKLLQYLPQGKPTALLPEVTSSKTTLNEAIKIAFPSKQTLLRLGQIGIDHRATDYFPLTVGNYILGGGALVSRLSNEVREKRGLTYGVGSQWVPMMREGPFLISLATEARQAADALKVTQTTLSGFIAQGPSEEELSAAKQYLSGSFPVLLSSSANIAQVLLQAAFFNLPDDYLETYVERINSVTLEQIKFAFQAHVVPEKMLLVSVGEV